MHKILMAALAVTILFLVVLTPAAGNTNPTIFSFTHLNTKKKVQTKTTVNTAKLLRRLNSSSRASVQTQLVKSKNVLRFWENHSWLLAKNHKKCFDVPWERSCTAARQSYRLHTSLVVAAKKRLFKELPMTEDWQTAVRIVQRVYPGTADWMLSISDREGGWGRWVWWSGSCGDPPCLWRGYHVGHDSTGDTVGGWMQFRWSTFAPYWRGAIKDLRKRGFSIPVFPNKGGPAMYQPWLNPLGQALTAGYMRYYGKDGCHWCL